MATCDIVTLNNINVPAQFVSWSTCKYGIQINITVVYFFCITQTLKLNAGEILWNTLSVARGVLCCESNYLEDVELWRLCLKSKHSILYISILGVEKLFII